jgi:hypothetical protein
MAIVLFGLAIMNSSEKVNEAAERRFAEELPCQLPPAASNTVILGNGWYTFELDGNKFMGRSHYHRQTITQVR